MHKSKASNLAFNVTAQAEGDAEVEQTAQLSQVCTHGALLISKIPFT